VTSLKRLSILLAAATLCAALIRSAGTLVPARLVSAAQPQQGSPQPRRPIDVARLGPQVGERVPEFTLPDQNGKSRTLQSIMGAKGAMLVFFRSADW
jgi:hypothetical protein